MVRTLIILRHGNTFDRGDTVTRVGARTDLPLSASGRVQVDALAGYFAGQPPFDQILAGPLKRTLETADAIAGDAIVTPCQGLREIDYGPDENRPEAEVVVRLGEKAIRTWDEDAVVPPGWKVDPDALIAMWRERFRAVAALPDGARVLAVTSNGVARFALRAAAHMPPGTPLKLRTAAWGEIEVDAAGAGRVIAWDVRVA